MGRPGGPGPLDPIFDVDTIYGFISYDNTPGAQRLTVTINQAAGQDDPTYSTPILFTAVFSRAVTGFATGDVVLTGTAGATTAVVTEDSPFDGTTWQVSVSGMTGSGTVQADVPSFAANAVDDGAPNAHSTSTDNVVTYNAGPPTSGLVAWYDGADAGTIHASGGFVTQWDDKSGNANHATVTPGVLGGPATGSRTQNGLNVIDFTNTAGSNTVGNNRSLVGIAGAASTYTMFVVNVQDNTAAATTTNIAAWGTPASAWNGLVVPTNTTQRQFILMSGGTATATGSSVANGTWALHTINITAGSAMTLRLNAVADASTTALGGVPAGSTLAFGTNSGGTRAWDGAIAEVLVYRPDLSSTDRDAVEAYLMNKWGLP